MSIHDSVGRSNEKTAQDDRLFYTRSHQRRKYVLVENNGFQEHAHRLSFLEIFSFILRSASLKIDIFYPRVCHFDIFFSNYCPIRSVLFM